MRKLFGAVIALISVLASTSAFARPHHVQHVRYYAKQARVQTAKSAPSLPDIFKMPIFSDVADYGGPMRNIRARVARNEQASQRRTYMTVNPREREEATPNIRFSNSEATVSDARPADCYGIQWCGCWARHHFGIADKSLNLAANWARVGSPTSPHSGAIVVWRGHVGVLQSEPDASGRALVLSGNNGSGNRATVRPAYVRNAIAFRQL
jgi:hypothetical protein